MGGITRRSLLGGLLGAVAGLALGEREVWALGPSSQLQLARVVPQGAMAGRAGAERRLVWEVLKRTSVSAQLEPIELSPSAPELYEHPFLLLAGGRAYPPLSEEEILRLRRHLRFGGFLYADDCGGLSGDGFDASFRRTVQRLFPRRPLEALSADHTVYRSFYLLDRPYGRLMRQGYLEGVQEEGRSLLIYGRNDLLGAWLRDALGGWQFPVSPGGEWQRERALRLGVNLVMYALCLNYKRDQVHVETLMRRRRWRPGRSR